VLEPQLTRVLAELDPNLTINSVRTMQEQVDLTFDQERVASLAGLFGLVALLLAAVGLYGVTAYTVAQRTSEIGIRMALGADRTKVVQLVLRGAFKRVLVGLVLAATGDWCGTPDLGPVIWCFLLGSARADGGDNFARYLRLFRSHSSSQPGCIYFAHERAQN
jgi:predicted lysophospholipase L1 biosynthesis ABC-type transport system permease subunit